MNRGGGVAIAAALVVALSIDMLRADDESRCPHPAAPVAPGRSEAASPYAGQTARGIQALSEVEIVGLLEGQGLGLARAAELNHYPGPKHVLELAAQLKLTDEQIQKTRSIYDEMHLRAVRLGQERVDKERALDADFRAGRVDEERLRATLSDIAQSEGQLRFVHLRAHLLERALLTPEQVTQYDLLRGYSGDTAAGGGHPAH